MNSQNMNIIYMFALACLAGYSLSDLLRPFINKSSSMLQRLVEWNSNRRICSLLENLRLECFGQNIEVMVCRDRDDIIRGLKKIGNVSMLGLDCEWRPKNLKGENEDICKKVAILQLASSRACLIIQLLRATDGPSVLPQELCDILSASSVLKVCDRPDFPISLSTS